MNLLISVLIMQIRHFLLFDSDYLYKMFCLANSLGRQCLLPEQRVGLLSISKDADAGSLNQASYLITQPIFCSGVIWYSSHCPLRTSGKNVDVPVTAIVVSDKMPLFYGPVVCSLPASMRLWQINCLLVNRVKSQSLQRQ